MSTKRKLIERAAASFGLSAAFDMSPEEAQEGLALLNMLAAEWEGMGISVGYDADAGISAESGVPAANEHAFVSNLATRWASQFGKTVPAELRAAAAMSSNALYVTLAKRPQMNRNPALPVGTGSRASVIDRQYFPESDDIEGLD
ncbi:MAG TPA: packaged DNA stabilization gp4 family protein [Ramlibacter sp.]|uniref:packaged DNA stabilization gp4 family protein n=1 Tax=Ramlibacter sp. TaxID=1917967 RepID=UPI002D808B48|nr:packaged DNA stabilization gp4 family protein [Ramlibacter sp.]HET8744310.1 packaged DNA stabilization gp4 family protein [Ramlibacter sp.]